MSLNSKVERKTDIKCLKTGEFDVESGDSKKNSLSAAISATSNQNGDQTGCEDGIMPEQEASERRRSGQTDARSSNNSPLPGQKPAEQLPRRNFQIPRKIKERKGKFRPQARGGKHVKRRCPSCLINQTEKGVTIQTRLVAKIDDECRAARVEWGRTDSVQSVFLMSPPPAS